MSALSKVTRRLNGAEERVVDRLREAIIIEAENHFALGREAAHLVEACGGGEFEILLRVDYPTSVFCGLVIVAHAPIHARFRGIHGIEIELARTGVVVFAFATFDIGHCCVVAQIFLRFIQVSEDVFVGSFERIDRAVGQRVGIGIGQAIFRIGVLAIVRTVEANQVKVQESTQTVGFAAHQTQAGVRRIALVQVGQHVVHVGNGLILRRPNVVHRRTHLLVRIIVVQNFRIGVARVEITEQLTEFVEETVRKVLAVEF